MTLTIQYIMLVVYLPIFKDVENSLLDLSFLPIDDVFAQAQAPRSYLLQMKSSQSEKTDTE